MIITEFIQNGKKYKHQIPVLNDISGGSFSVSDTSSPDGIVSISQVPMVYSPVFLPQTQPMRPVQNPFPSPLGKFLYLVPQVMYDVGVNLLSNYLYDYLTGNANAPISTTRTIDDIIDRGDRTDLGNQIAWMIETVGIGPYPNENSLQMDVRIDIFDCLMFRVYITSPTRGYAKNAFIDYDSYFHTKGSPRERIHILQNWGSIYSITPNDMRILMLENVYFLQRIQQDQFWIDIGNLFEFDQYFPVQDNYISWLSNQIPLDVTQIQPKVSIEAGEKIVYLPTIQIEKRGWAA